MRATIYQYTGRVTRSILRASEVRSMEIDALPDDEEQFAQEHGGDFIQLDPTDCDE